jgi:hypothetical protein
VIFRYLLVLLLWAYVFGGWSRFFQIKTENEWLFRLLTS